LHLGHPSSPDAFRPFGVNAKVNFPSLGKVKFPT